MSSKIPLALLVVFFSALNADTQTVTPRSAPAIVNGPLGKLPQYLPLEDVVIQSKPIPIVKSQALPVICPIGMSKPECGKRQPPFDVEFKDSFE